MISDATIREFQAVIKAEFGVTLNDKDATETLLNWVAYFDLLAKINHRIETQTSELVPIF